MEAGATIAAALGVTGAVLAPDPVWGAGERRGAATLPDPDAGAEWIAAGSDAQLVTLCNTYIAAVTAYNADGGTLDPEDDPAWAALEELEDQLERLPARTLAGVAAKARVAVALGRNRDGTVDLTPSACGPWPAEVVRDVLRLAGEQVPA